MKMWSLVRSWLRAMLRRSRMEREMDAELHFHIEAFAEDLARSGVPREEALQRARIEFGGVERAKEECRDRKSTRLNSSHSQISYAVFCLKNKNTHTLLAGTPTPLTTHTQSLIVIVIRPGRRDPTPPPAPPQSTPFEVAMQPRLTTHCPEP